jgi:hypothetical protein
MYCSFANTENVYLDVFQSCQNVYKVSIYYYYYYYYYYYWHYRT